MNNHYYEMSFKIHAIVFQTGTELTLSECCQPFDLNLTTASLSSSHPALPAALQLCAVLCLELLTLDLHGLFLLSFRSFLKCDISEKWSPTAHSVSLLSVFSQPLNTKWYYMYFKFTDSCHSECTLPGVIDSLRNPHKPLLLFKTLSEAFPRRLMSHCDREEDLPDFQVPPMIQSLSRMKFYR